jgi:hypothetical protein
MSPRMSASTVSLPMQYPRLRKLVDNLRGDGGPCTYTGRDMKHPCGMNITEGQFNALVKTW